MWWPWKAVLLCLLTFSGCLFYNVCGVVVLEGSFLLPDCVCPFHIKNNGFQDPTGGLFWDYFSLKEAVVLKVSCWRRVAECFSSCMAALLESWWPTVALVLAFYGLADFVDSCSLCALCLYIWPIVRDRQRMMTTNPWQDKFYSMEILFFSFTVDVDATRSKLICYQWMCPK